MKTIYLAGGCFWGMQKFFDQFDGVLRTEVGYANGPDKAPSYEDVCADSGHAETLRIDYDETRISLAELLKYYFMVIDPLSVNRQGHDEGIQYRTGIYYTDESLLPDIRSFYQAEERKAGAKLAVELEPLRNFFSAEEYHQKYLDKNPGGYCHLPLKAFRYLRLWQDLRLWLGDEVDPVARMATAAAMIFERMRFFWVGFYRVAGEQLVLGPFQGPAACLRIGYGKGVCGTAWARGETIVVPDVEAFPGHIACSSLSRSEIVVPVGTPITAVLDIDSTELGTFDRFDAAFLELIAGLM